MNQAEKTKSPFYPGQPVPPEFLAGRKAEIELLLTRGANQVAQGKPQSYYVQGEYGIGKSSVAAYLQRVAEAKYGLHPFYVSLGGCKDLQDLATAILLAIVKSEAMQPEKPEAIRNWLANFIGEQSLFGIKVNMEALRSEAPQLTNYQGLLSFLADVKERLGKKCKGICLVLDELNGLASVPEFAHFLKALVDSNSQAISGAPVPLLLLLCGTAERRKQLLENHPSIDRVFDVITIGPIDADESAAFFRDTFQSVGMQIEEESTRKFVFYAAGLPRMMQLIGDNAYWIDQDGVIDKVDDIPAVVRAADEAGKKYVDQQIYRALRSKDYHAILAKIAESGMHSGFKISELKAKLTEAESKKLNNFLQKMKKLGVLASGEEKGEYVFNIRMVQLYIWLTKVIDAQASRD